jgi:hypothetical protein
VRELSLTLQGTISAVELRQALVARLFRLIIERPKHSSRTAAAESNGTDGLFVRPRRVTVWLIGEEGEVGAHQGRVDGAQQWTPSGRVFGGARRAECPNGAPAWTDLTLLFDAEF